AGPGPQSGEDVLIGVEGGQHQHLRRLTRHVQHQAGGLQSVDLRHPDVHQHHIGPSPPHLSVMPAPSSAVPTTSISSCASSRAAKPARIMDWSLTMSTRTDMTVTLSQMRRWARPQDGDVVLGRWEVLSHYGSQE